MVVDLGGIRLSITAESETRDDRDSGKGWQQIRRWRRGNIDTASAGMWHRGDTLGGEIDVV